MSAGADLMEKRIREYLEVKSGFGNEQARERMLGKVVSLYLPLQCIVSPTPQRLSHPTYSERVQVLRYRLLRFNRPLRTLQSPEINKLFRKFIRHRRANEPLRRRL